MKMCHNENILKNYEWISMRKVWGFLEIFLQILDG